MAKCWLIVGLMSGTEKQKFDAVYLFLANSPRQKWVKYDWKNEKVDCYFTGCV